jgi:hypothetical protein
VESPPLAPAATSATPENETATAIQWRSLRRSTPPSCEKRATKTGSVPKRSATVDAVVRRDAYAMQIWFRKMPTAARSASKPRSRRETLRLRSRRHVTAVKTVPAIAQRTGA